MNKYEVTGATRRWPQRLLLLVGPLLVVAVFVAVSGGPLSRPLRAQYPTANVWRFEPIPVSPELARQATTGDVAGNLAVDGEGRTHWVFGSPDLVYALRDDTGWSFETVGPGSEPSLALDSTSAPHLTYFHDDALHYAVRDGGQWTISHSIATAGAPHGLALDSGDRPHIAFISPEPYRGSPAYATWDGSQWQQVVVAPDWHTANAGLALGAAGEPTVVYERSDYPHYQIVAATPGAARAWQETVLLDFHDFSTNIYDWRPETMQVSGDAAGRTLVSLAYGAEFIIKPPYIMYHYAELARHAPAGFDGGLYATMYSLGYDTAAPAYVTHAAGLGDDLFMALVIQGDLWFADNASDPWQKLAAGVWGASPPAVGPDGQPLLVMSDSDGIWLGRRVEVELRQQAFLPVAGNRWLGDWLPPEPLNTTVRITSGADALPIGPVVGFPAVSDSTRLTVFEDGPVPWEVSGVVLNDRATGRSWCISVDPDGQCHRFAGAPAITADGRLVAFEARIALLPDDTDDPQAYDIYLYDVAAGSVSLVSHLPDLADPLEDALGPAFSADGRTLAFVHGQHDYGIIIADIETGQSSHLAESPANSPLNGRAGHLSLSADGRFIAFTYSADVPQAGDDNGLPDVFVYDRQEKSIELVSVRSDGGAADGPSSEPVISAGGRYVVFTSGAGNLSPGDYNSASDIFRHDRLTGETIRVSPNLIQVGAGSYAPAISADGRLIVFESYANFGLAADTNNYNDVYLVEVGHAPELVSVNTAGLAGNRGSATPVISADGQFVVFKSEATDLVAGGASHQTDTYLRRVR